MVLQQLTASSTAAYLAATKMLVHFSNSAIRETLADIFRGKLEYERFDFGKLHKIVIFKPDDAVRQIGILEEEELQSLLKSTDRAGKTALCWAAHLNRGDIIQELLRTGAKVIHQDFDGNSSFHFAAQAVGTFALSQLLLSDPRINDCHVAIKNKGGWQPLHHASHYQTNPRFAEMLVQAGVFVDAKTNAGKTPVMMAALMQRPRVVRLLHRSRADMNCQDRAGWTALSLVINNVAASFETVDALLEAKVSLHGQSIRQESVLHLVAKTPSLEMMKYLISRARSHASYLGYVNVNGRNYQGFTAKELLLNPNPTREIENAFDTLQSLLDPSGPDATI